MRNRCQIAKVDLHVVQQIGSIPEIRVKRYDPQFGILRMINAVSSIVSTSLLCSLRGDPVVLLPQRGDMIPIPGSAKVSRGRNVCAQLTVADPKVPEGCAGN